MYLPLHKKISLVPCLKDKLYFSHHSEIIDWFTFHKKYGKILCHLYIYKNYINKDSELLKVVQKILKETKGFKKKQDKIFFASYTIDNNHIRLELKNVYMSSSSLFNAFKKGRTYEL